MLKMTDQDATAPKKKPRSEAQIASSEKARAKSRELRASRNVIREKHNISDDTDETPIDETDEAETDDAETDDAETEDEDDVSQPAVVEKKEPVKNLKNKKKNLLNLRQIQHQNLHDKQLLINQNKKM
jgi:hypothetical protein